MELGSLGSALDRAQHPRCEVEHYGNMFMGEKRASFLSGGLNAEGRDAVSKAFSWKPFTMLWEIGRQQG